LTNKANSKSQILVNFHLDCLKDDYKKKNKDAIKWHLLELKHLNK